MALTKPFAENGNKTTIPATTSNGSVSYDQGFGSFYALPPEEGGLFIDRAQFNQLMYDTTSAVISNQNSINTLNSKVTANQNSINTLNEKVADIESGVATGVVNLTTNQTINGVKTFTVPPVSATNPSNNNQVANKAYVDTVGNSKAGFVTRTLAIGANEDLKNLNDFRLFAVRNFANCYILSLTSDIEETEALVMRGINFSINSTDFSITFKKPVDLHHCTLMCGKLHIKLEDTAYVNFLLCKVHINGNFSLTDTMSNDSSSAGLRFYGSTLNTGGNDVWTINTTSRSFIDCSNSYLGIINIDFIGNIPPSAKLIKLGLQGILMTQWCNFEGFTVTDIAQNQLTNKGIWFNT